MSTPQAQATIPAIPEPGRDIDPQTRRTILALKEALETRLGRGRTPLDAAVTFRDLAEGDFDITLGGPSTNGGIQGGTIPPFINLLPEPDFSVPPAPTNLATFGGFDYVFLTWDRPVSIVGDYFTEIYRYTTDNLGEAQNIGAIGFTQGPGIQYSDKLDAIFTYYYWARFVKVVYGTLIPGPFNATAGIPGSITLNPDYVIDIIQGYISESELAEALATRIDLIDADDTVAGSVSARLLEEAQARLLALGLTNGRINDVAGSGNSIEQFYADYQQDIAALETEIGSVTATQTRLTALEQSIDDVKGDGSNVALEQFYVDYLATELLAQTANATATATATDITLLQTQVNDIEGVVDAEAFGQRVSELEVGLANAEGDINATNTLVGTVKTTADTAAGNYTALSSTVQQLSVDLNGLTGAFEQQATVTATVDGTGTAVNLDGKYTVKFDLAGYVAGFGLSASTSGASEFIIRAEHFYCLDPSMGGTFVRGQNYPTVEDLPAEFVMGYAKVDGVTRFAFNAPVYIPEASITNLHIKDMDFTKITGFDINTEILNVNQTGWITNAMIGNVIQGTWPTEAQPAWKLDKFGYATFRGINIYHLTTGELLLSSGSGITWEAVYGALPADKVATGSGTNLLGNTDFPNNSVAGWHVAYNPNGAIYPALQTETKRAGAGSSFNPAAGDAIVLIQSGFTSSNSAKQGTDVIAYDVYPMGDTNALGRRIPVVAGTRYEFSAIAGCHRCYLWLIVVFFNSNGVPVGQAEYKFTNSWPDTARRGLGAVAPTGAVYCETLFRKTNTLSSPDSYVWIHQPYFGAAGAAQTEFSPYSPGTRAGALASLNQIDSSNRASTIAPGTFGAMADVNQINSSNRGSFIAAGTFGALADVSQFTQWNVPEYFAPESIDAITYIKHLSVDTAQIRGQAVTFPSYLGADNRVVPYALTAHFVSRVEWYGSGAPVLLNYAHKFKPPFRQAQVKQGVNAVTVWVSYNTVIELRLNGVVMGFPYATTHDVLIPGIFTGDSHSLTAFGQPLSANGLNVLEVYVRVTGITTPFNFLSWQADNNGIYSFGLMVIEAKK